jgi:hypothetical protein
MTTTTTARERLALYEAEIPEAQAAFDKAVAALLSVGSDVSHNLQLLGEEITEEVLVVALDNIEHLAHLADLARNAKERLADAVFVEAAARQELEDLRRYEEDLRRYEAKHRLPAWDRATWNSVPAQATR